MWVIATSCDIVKSYIKEGRSAANFVKEISGESYELNLIENLNKYPASYCTVTPWIFDSINGL